MLLTIFLVTNATKPYFGEHPELLAAVPGFGHLQIGPGSLQCVRRSWRSGRVVPGAVSIAKKYLMAVVLYSVVASLLPVIAGVPQESYQEFAGQTLFNSFSPCPMQSPGTSICNAQKE